MKKREPVSKIMTKDLYTLNHSNSLKDAEEIFDKNGVRHLPVVSGDQLVGMISLTDMQRVSFVDNFSDTEGHIDTAVYDMLTIEQVMVKDVVKVSPDTTIKEAAEMLASKEFHALPVVEDGHLRGIVTTTDLIKYLVDQY